MGAAKEPNETRDPERVVSTMPVVGSTEKETPATGPRPVPLIVISPGAIEPNAPLAELVTDVTTTLGAAALTDSETEIVCGLFSSPIHQASSCEAHRFLSYQDLRAGARRQDPKHHRERQKRGSIEERWMPGSLDKARPGKS